MIFLGVSDSSVVIRVNHNFIIVIMKYLIVANIRPNKNKHSICNIYIFPFSRILSFIKFMLGFSIKCVDLIFLFT